GASTWLEAPLAPKENDRWGAAFEPDALGCWEYTVCAWVDAWQTWLWGFHRKLSAAQDVRLELRAGAALIVAAGARAEGPARDALLRHGDRLSRAELDRADALAATLEGDLGTLMRAHADRRHATFAEPALQVIVDRPRARFGAWYEMFPRSRVATADDSADAAPTHATFRESAQRLSYIADMGFDVVYLPPIHPIGRRHRKGRDNSLEARPEDPGSPWAIGAAEGGHMAVHPQLGTLEDFRSFLGTARAQGLEVALDIALQASPDHPDVTAHPEWFVHRADGSIQFAENPPKTYEDIYPFDFAGPAWQTLWNELRDVFLFWIEQGVTIFRVDNPHTKPLPFWRWCLASVKAQEPRAIFLSEAFTRPKMMRALAKAGFSQSYTYFTWRTTKAELTEYVTSLLADELPDYFRPSFWPNTPDILPEQLQQGTRATFIARAALAATLSPTWGIYGPAFELQEKVARDGTEEYARSEKYEIRAWNLERPDNLAPVLRRLNQIRRDNPALHRLEGTTFHATDNEQLMAFSRATDDRTNVLLVVVNLDAHHRHGGWITLDLVALGLPADAHFQVHDLVGDARYLWSGGRAYVELDPSTMPLQIFRVHRHHRSERSFDYYQ
ncbi:MAG: alpha amylase catalytic sub domain protein, partial [Myxococcales bacterium]|nr:alpha amylase catalytic sub domain protein [Myxococcales bacterium]